MFDCISLEIMNETVGDFLITLVQRNNDIEILNAKTGVPITMFLMFLSNYNKLKGKIHISNFLSGNLLIGTTGENLQFLRWKHMSRIQNNEYQITIKKLEFLSLWYNDSNAVVGGERSELIIIDLKTGQKKYEAKILEAKSWAKCYATLSNECVIVASMFNKLRLYDVRMRNKSVQEFSGGFSSLICGISDTNWSCWFGNHISEIKHFNTRADGLVVALKHNFGCIFSLDKHPTKPIIASVSEDQWLRIYDTKKRQTQVKISHRKQTNCVRFGLYYELK